jgi:hypothetical protein
LNRTSIELLEYCHANGRVCPQPQRWQALYELLPNKQRVDGGWQPALPLILAAWWHTSDAEKATRFAEHVMWAYDRGAPEAAADFVMTMAESDWHHSGE